MKKSSKKHNFYLKWWFWATILLLFVGTWMFMFIENIDLRSSVIGILSIWGSTIATIAIGIIAAKQSEHYTFITRKQSYIDSVRFEEQKFLQDFSQIEKCSFYIDLATDFVYAKGGDPREEMRCFSRHNELCNNIIAFMHTITTYEYCPLHAKDMLDECKNMLDYLKNDLNIITMPHPLEKEFQEKCVASIDYIMDWQSKIIEIKHKYIIQFQVLIHGINSCNNLNSLDKQVNRIADKTQKMRDEIALFNYFSEKKDGKQ